MESLIIVSVILFFILAFLFFVTLGFGLGYLYHKSIKLSRNAKTAEKTDIDNELVERNLRRQKDLQKIFDYDVKKAIAGGRRK